MECNRTATNLTRSVHLNRNHQFDSSTVCKRQILRWLPNWQLFGVPSDMIHLTGLVEACGVKTYSDHLTVPLIFTSTRQDGRPFQTCLSDRRVKNVISHSRRHKWVGVQTSQPIATKFAMSLEGHLGENIG
nr:hypothetical protein BaRGS_020161 [Batillaria attramentaria]